MNHKVGSKIKILNNFNQRVYGVGEEATIVFIDRDGSICAKFSGLNRTFYIWTPRDNGPANEVFKVINPAAISLEAHAKSTIKTLERFLAQRGWTTGVKKWEKDLLFSAYESLEIPMHLRKFGLDKP